MAFFRLPRLLLALPLLLLTCAPTSISKSYVLSSGAEAVIPNRAVYFEGEVTDESMALLANAIDAEHAKGSKNIMLVLNSPGGSVDAGFNFIMAVEKFKRGNQVEFTCVVDGMAASMMAVIFEAVCDTRLMTKRSMLLFHGARIGPNGGGTQEILEENAEIIRVINEMMAAMVAPRMGMSEEAFLYRIKGRDWSLSWRDAIRAKAIDGTIDVAAVPGL